MIQKPCLFFTNVIFSIFHQCLLTCHRPNVRFKKHRNITLTTPAFSLLRPPKHKHFPTSAYAKLCMRLLTSSPLPIIFSLYSHIGFLSKISFKLPITNFKGHATSSFLPYLSSLVKLCIVPIFSVTDDA